MNSSSKIAIGWCVVIAAGLSSFVFARDLVVGNRKVLMDTRQKIRAQAEREGNLEFERRRQERADAKSQTQAS